MITGCGSHPPSAERMEELEESVWNVVQQRVYMAAVRPELVYGGIEKGTGNRLEVAEMRMLRWM